MPALVPRQLTGEWALKLESVLVEGGLETDDRGYVALTAVGPCEQLPYALLGPHQPKLAIAWADGVPRRYTFGAQIGAGEFATVYRGSCTSDDGQAPTPVAIKLFTPSKLNTKHAKDAVQREVDSLRALVSVGAKHAVQLLEVVMDSTPSPGAAAPLPFCLIFE